MYMTTCIQDYVRTVVRMDITEFVHGTYQVIRIYVLFVAWFYRDSNVNSIEHKM